MPRPLKQMTKDNLTFRLDHEKKLALDYIAEAQDRDRSYILNEAVTLYLELYRWQIAHIQEGLRQADGGRLISHEDLAAKLEAKRAYLMD